MINCGDGRTRTAVNGFAVHRIANSATSSLLGVSPEPKYNLLCKNFKKQNEKAKAAKYKKLNVKNYNQ